MPTASLTSSLTSFIGDHGVYAVFLLMLIDAVFPAASELVMVYAGALAAGAFAGQEVSLFGATIESAAGGFVVMSLAGTLGYQAGSVLGWLIGDYGGRPLLDRHGRWLHLSPAKLDRAERWFERWGSRAVFLGRITPVARSFISIPAGVFRQPFGPYFVSTLAGSALWSFAFAGVGWGFGRSYERFNHAFRYVEIAVLVVIVLAAALWVWRRLSTRLARRAGDTTR